MIPDSMIDDPITQAEYALWLDKLEAERLKDLADFDDQCRVWAAQDDRPAAGEPWYPDGLSPLPVPLARCGTPGHAPDCDCDLDSVPF